MPSFTGEGLPVCFVIVQNLSTATTYHGMSEVQCRRRVVLIAWPPAEEPIFDLAIDGGSSRLLGARGLGGDR